MMTGSLIFTQFTTAAAFAYTAKTCLRLLSLNIAFKGAVHYGIGGALYEISTLPYLKRIHSYQVMYSFLPGVLSFGIVQNLLSRPEVTQELLMGSFGALSILQIASFIIDKRYIGKEQMPQWYFSFRVPTFLASMVLTILIFAAIFSRFEIFSQRDNNRIDTLTKLMELDDVDFLKQVNETNIQFDEEDMRILQNRFKREEMYQQRE